MRNTILANRYAKALFSVAKEDDSFDAISKALNEVSELFDQVPEVKDGLTNPLYPVEVRAKVMDHIISNLDTNAVMKNFLNLVIIKKRADVLPEIAHAFQSLVDGHRNICQGSVVSAMELSDELKQKVQATLEKITGKKVVLSAEVDPAVIGGIIAQVGDLVLDGSIRTQLMGLKESIKGSE